MKTIFLKNQSKKYIIKLAEKYKLSEVYVAKKAIECSKKYKRHVGFFLIGDQKYLLQEGHLFSLRSH